MLVWIDANDEVPADGEEVVGMRADGWWDKVMWTHSHGWYCRGIAHKRLSNGSALRIHNAAYQIQ